MAGSRSNAEKGSEKGSNDVVESAKPRLKNAIKEDKIPSLVTPPSAHYLNSDGGSISGSEDKEPQEDEEPQNDPIVILLSDSPIPNEQNNQGQEPQNDPIVMLLPDSPIPNEQNNQDQDPGNHLESGGESRPDHEAIMPYIPEEDANPAIEVQDQKQVSWNTDHNKGFIVGFLTSGLGVGLHYLIRLIPGLNVTPSPSLTSDAFNTAISAGFARKAGHMWNNEYTRLDKVVGCVIHTGTALFVAEAFRYGMSAIGTDPNDAKIIPGKMAVQGMLAPVLAEVADRGYSLFKQGLFRLAKYRDVVNPLHHAEPSEPGYASLPSGPSKR